MYPTFFIPIPHNVFLPGLAHKYGPKQILISYTHINSVLVQTNSTEQNIFTQVSRA